MSQSVSKSGKPKILDVDSCFLEIYSLLIPLPHTPHVDRAASPEVKIKYKVSFLYQEQWATEYTFGSDLAETVLAFGISAFPSFGSAETAISAEIPLFQP